MQSKIVKVSEVNSKIVLWRSVVNKKKFSDLYVSQKNIHLYTLTEIEITNPLTVKLTPSIQNIFCDSKSYALTSS